MARRARAFAPGRVNLIGEHTDYNDGLCLAFSIAHGVTVAALPLPGREIEAHALDLDELHRFRPGQDAPPSESEMEARRAVGREARGDGWPLFVRGAVAELRRSGIEAPPCRIEIAGALPRGAGLGSSAALCVSLCLALCATAGAEPPAHVELARLCSRVENDWVGAQTGLLDQLASLCGRPGQALRIDLRGPRLAPVALTLGEHRLVVLASGASRRLARSGYNARREECRLACRSLGVRSLRDADPAAAARLPQPLRRRVRHVLSENGRVDAAAVAVERGDLDRLGRLLDASHASLRDDYEVSLPEVERARDACKRSGASGARIMGGGFGGSVLALFGPGSQPPAGAFGVEPSRGARLLA